MSCDVAVVHALPSPLAAADGPIVMTGHTTSDGVLLAGAKIVWLSGATMANWAALLAHPETTDEWLPPSLGTKSVERLDPTHLYQQNDVSLLAGLIRIHRQAVVQIHWAQLDGDRVSNCWWVEDPATWKGALETMQDDSEFLLHGQGGWSLEPVSGGVSVSYSFWSEAKMVPAQLEAWIMSRTLPDLAHAFEDRAISMSAH